MESGPSPNVANGSIPLSKSDTTRILFLISEEFPVKIDGNEPFLCWTAMQFIAASSFQITLKEQNL
jgi:hypothetical protein